MNTTTRSVLDRLEHRIARTVGMIAHCQSGVIDTLECRFDVKDADEMEIGIARREAHQAWLHMRNVIDLIRSVRDRQPVKPLTPAEQAAECEGRA